MFVLYFIVFIIIIIIIFIKKKNYIYSNLNTRLIEREILYLEYSIIGGNSPFNNFKKNGEITMLSISRLKNIRYIIHQIIQQNIEGDILEAGNWRGGSMLYAKGVLEAYGIKNKKIWMFDTFCGFPNNSVISDKKEIGLISGKDVERIKSNSIDKVKALFTAYNLNVGINFISGKFEDTILKTSIPKLSYLRLDADSYYNTKFLLENLYNKLNENGYIEFDDYGSFTGCKRAVDEFRQNNNIKNEMKFVNEINMNSYEAVYWKKGL